MTTFDSQQMEYKIARCRLILSAAAIIVVYVEPQDPIFARWIPIVSGSFTIDSKLLVVMGTHLAYSLAMYFGLRRPLAGRTISLTPWVDMLFGVAIATMTEGLSSPAYMFFAFAVVATGLRGSLRTALAVTVVSVALYVGLIFLAMHAESRALDMLRPVYLGITGYLVGYLGHQRLELQRQMRQLEIDAQRHRIARELHDGYAQALAGIVLRLESSRRLLRAERLSAALTALTDLQESVKREYADLRGYARSLAGLEPTPPVVDEQKEMSLSMSADLCGSMTLIDHVLGIAREGLSNVSRHARASAAKIAISADRSQVCIDIQDDGVGFPSDVTPWSIASRVKEMGGQIRIVNRDRQGAHLLITLPQV